MPLRLIEIMLPREYKEQVEHVREALEEQRVLGVWHEDLSEDTSLLKVLIEAEDVEAVLDPLEKRFSPAEGFRIVLLPVEATIPRPEEPKKSEEEEEEPPAEAPPKPMIGRVSREELYNRISDTAKLSSVFIVMALLSAIVATLGVLRDNVAVVIGGMVIAPLLGPNVAFSLATTLGDVKFAFGALKSFLSGIAVALVVSIVTGALVTVDPTVPEIASRTQVNLGDIAVALASGVAGALAFTTAIPTALVGVMVAVALLPPLVTFGLLMGSGQPGEALGAVLLFLTNLVCVNLAGVVTFLIQGVRPINWWEAERAKRATRIALLLWAVLLGALAAFIFLSQRID